MCPQIKKKILKSGVLEFEYDLDKSKNKLSVITLDVKKI